MASTSAPKRGDRLISHVAALGVGADPLRLLGRIDVHGDVAGMRLRLDRAGGLADDDVAAAGAERRRAAGVEHFNEPPPVVMVPPSRAARTRMSPAPVWATDSTIASPSADRAAE